MADEAEVKVMFDFCNDGQDEERMKVMSGEYKAGQID